MAIPTASSSRRDWLRTTAAGAIALATAGGLEAKIAAERPRFIDVHTHIGRYRDLQKNLTAAQLVEWMDIHRIEKSVVLPLVSPESTTFLQTPEMVLQGCSEFPTRLIPFCSIDPRAGYGSLQALKDILSRYKDLGAKGFGEHKVGLPFDHPRMMMVYEACQDLKLPLLFHMDNIRGTDEPGLPGLARALVRFPELPFIGHGPGWWASISGGLTNARELSGYPTGKVTAGGAIDGLMESFPNIYADLSAGSGNNGITRDREFGQAFLIRRADRVMFGSDYLAPGQDVPQFATLESFELPDEVRRKIYRGNAIRVLNLTE
jgi:predicted TIM-barrel fold metal-dependent hydrolase